MLKRKISICCACSNNSSVLLAEKFEQEQQVSKHCKKKKKSFLDLFTRNASADSGVHKRPCGLSKSPVPLLISTVQCLFKYTKAI